MPQTSTPPGSNGVLELDTCLYDQVRESIAIYRCDGTCLYINPATERLFGRTREETVGRGLQAVFPEGAGHRFHQAFQRVARTGQSEEFEHYYAPWGRWFSNRMIRSGERVYVFSWEITPRKRMEAERAEYYAHTERLFEQTRLAEQRAAFLARASEVLASTLEQEEILHHLARLVVPTLADWCVVDVLAADGSIRRAALDQIHPERIARACAALARAPMTFESPSGSGRVLRTGTPEFIPEFTPELLELMVADPEERRVLRECGLRASMCVPLNSRGRTLGALTLLYADSRRRYTDADVRLVEDLARRAATSLDNGLLYKQAQEAVRARDSFLSVASHELNTPLTSLNLNVQSLQRALVRAAQAPLPRDTVEAKLQSVQRQVSRLAKLVHELLDVSRISAGKLRLEREDVDLRELARELTPRFTEDLARAGCELRLEAPEAVVGHWDKLRVEQVLQNLLSNAIKYGRGRPIELCVGADERRARVAIRDQGIGIPPEGRARLFQRFERMASERHYSGFGLGLWIVKQIVDAMGGHIQVESEPGQGSVFTVELPRWPVDEPTPNVA